MGNVRGATLAPKAQLEKAVMKKPVRTVTVEPVEPLIRVIRGERVISDSDLARIYGVPTKRLNEQVRHNAERFLSDFMFRLTIQEAARLSCSKSQLATLDDPQNRSQFATGSQKHRDPCFLPYTFTEHGAIMAANILNSLQAVRNRKSEIGHLQSSEAWPAAPTGTKAARDWIPRCPSASRGTRAMTNTRNSHLDVLSPSPRGRLVVGLIREAAFTTLI